MNKGLSRTHLGLAIFYCLVAVVVLTVHMLGSISRGDGGIQADWQSTAIIAGIFGFPVVLHAIARRGVRGGKPWGRTCSRVLGILLLFAIPVGTVFGIFILLRTRNKDWQAA